MNPAARRKEFESTLLGRRGILIDSVIDEALTNVVIAKFLFLHKADAASPIHLYINSHGGLVTCTLAILDTMEHIGVPIHTHGLSRVSGTALWIIARGAPSHRRCQRDTSLSIERTRLDAVTPDNVAPLVKLNGRLADLLLSRTRLSHADVIQALEAGGAFSPDEALSAGIVDAVSSVPLLRLPGE